MVGFTVEIEVANQEDLVLSKAGYRPSDQTRRLIIPAVVNPDTLRLRLPQSVVSELHLPSAGSVNMTLSDGSSARWPIVEMVRVRFQDRSAVFTAVVEPGRTEAQIGATLLEELDLVVAPTGGSLIPRTSIADAPTDGASSMLSPEDRRRKIRAATEKVLTAHHELLERLAK